MKKYTVALSCLLFSTLSIGAEKDHHHHSHDTPKKKEDHSAHEHGVAKMNLAKVGDEIQIELTTPSFNLLGFEHKPNTKDQEAVVERTEKILNNPAELVVFKGSSCDVEHASIASPFEADDHKSHKHDAHKHESHDKHSKETEDSHSEYDVEYHFDCKNIAGLQSVDLSSLFSKFPNFSEIRVQWLSDDKQGSSELTAKNHLISLK